MVTVILNASAGGGSRSGLREEIAELFLAARLPAQIVQLKHGEDPGAAVTAACATSSIVVAAGGDGTVSSVAAALAGTAATLGVLPLGTLNHFAKALQIPLDLEQAVATIAAGHVGAVDVGRVNGCVFVNNSSIGLYPGIVELREELRRHGHRKWPAFALATLHVLRRYRGLRVRIEIAGREEIRRSPFVFVGNNEYAIDGIHLGGRTRLDRGLLFLYLAPRVRTRDLPMVFVRALLGRVRRAGDFEIVSATEFHLRPRRASRIRIAVDGEIRTMTPPLHFQIVPGPLNVLMPSV